MIIALVLKVIVLTFVMLVSFIVAGLVTGQQAETTEGANTSLLPLLAAVCFLNAIVLTYPIVRSRWSGLRLIMVIFVVFYGVMSVMSLIEAVFFMTNIPASEIAKFFLVGAIVALFFSPLAVLVLSKMKRDPTVEGPNSRLIMSWRQWVWKLAVIAVSYPIIYFAFGYFVAWQNPAVREFYGGGPLIGFFPHMRTVLQDMPLLISFQVLRAMMWVALALPVIRMMKGKSWEAVLAVGLLFAVLHTSQLLLPNPYMPQEVRMVHLVETAPSIFIFGLLVAWLLNRPSTKRASAHAVLVLG